MSPAHRHKCSVKGCEETAEKALSISEALKAFRSTQLSIEKGSRKAYLCKKHYKEYKKAVKKEKKLLKWRWMR